MSNTFFDSDSEYMSEEEVAALEKQVYAVSTKKALPRSVQETEREEPSINQEIYEEIFSDEDLENDEELLTDVSLRLEQGRLYQMILNHDLFKDVDAPAKAIANVQREIRQHIKSRLAVLLGLKPDNRVVQSKSQDFPFTDMEVNLLKTLLVKLSNGATEKYKDVPEMVKENKISSVSEKKPQTIVPLTTSKSVQKVSVAKPIAKPVAKPAAYKSADKATAPSLNMPKTRFEQIKELEAELEATAKPFVEMTPQEVQARNIQISKLEVLKKPPRPANAIPMPSQDGANAAYTAMANVTASNFSQSPMGKALGGKQ